MYFNSLDALLAMEGHGPFVWSAYAITLVVIAWLVVVPLRQRRQLIERERRRLRREQAQVQCDTGDR